MKNLTVKINDQEVSIKKYEGQRVVTFKDIDQCHGRPNGTARRNFNRNKKHLIEGIDYFVRNSYEAKSEFDTIAPNGLILLTESGYLMLVKSFIDDLAWQVQRQLVNTYFKLDEVESHELLKVQAQQERAAAMLLNSKIRAIKSLEQTGIMGQDLSPIAIQVLYLKTIEESLGINLGQYLPQTDATYSATQLAEEFNATPNQIGRLANANGLKVEKYGVKVMDKSPYSCKEVPAFRYNEAGRAKIKELLNR